MTGEIFGSFAGDYDRHRPDYPDAMWHELLADPSSIRDVVDVGAGTGRAALELSRRGLQVTAIEPEAGMRREAQRRAREAGHEHHGEGEFDVPYATLLYRGDRSDA